MTRAQKGLDERILSTCKRVPFGHCLCGLAASTRQIQFAANLDDRHTVRFETMPPHGHYCIPILFADRLLGVMILYLKAGHQRHLPDEEFLTSVANTLAGIIARRDAEEARLQSERAFNLLLKNVPALVFKGAADGSVVFFDDKVKEMTGYSRTVFESGRLKWTTLILEEDFHKARTEFIRALKGPRSYVREYRINCGDALQRDSCAACRRYNFRGPGFSFAHQMLSARNHFRKNSPISSAACASRTSAAFHMAPTIITASHNPGETTPCVTSIGFSKPILILFA